MGLDELHLRVLATSSEDLDQRRNAQTGNSLYPVHSHFSSNNSSAVDEKGEALGISGKYFFLSE